jgi:hypothetical protein
LHIRDYGLQADEDKKIFSLAKQKPDTYILILTFGTILHYRESKPVILFRRGLTPTEKLPFVLSNPPSRILGGAVVVFGTNLIRTPPNP